MKLPFDDCSRRRLYLVRHGQSAASEEAQGLYGDAISLTEQGLREARAMADALSRVSFEETYCSPIFRARRTAEIILGGKSGNLIASEDFVEIKGDLAPLFAAPGGLRSKQAAFAYAMWKSADPDARFFDRESYGSYFDRAGQTLDAIVRRSAASQILIVSHSGFQRAALSWAINAPGSAMPSFEQDTCCLNILDIDVDATGTIVRKHLRLANYTPLDPIKLNSPLTDGEQLAHRFAAQLGLEQV